MRAHKHQGIHLLTRSQWSFLQVNNLETELDKEETSANYER